MSDISRYLNGDELYGDDFDIDAIEKWYAEEESAYERLETDNVYNYKYHALNKTLGFSALDQLKYKNVLGFGSASGCELKPLSGRIENIHIVDASEALASNAAANLSNSTIRYSKPRPSGALEFPDDFFDLITCFGCLHHIPNVSFVISELVRCAKSGGKILIREPITSMGDWTRPRPGLTKNERGIPLDILDAILSASNLRIIKRNLCMFSISNIINRKMGINIYNHTSFILLDTLLSRTFRTNYSYHASSFIEKIRPTSIFIVAEKT